MRELGRAGVRRGRRGPHHHPGPAADRPRELARRQFSAPAPDRLWVADFTCYVLMTVLRHGRASTALYIRNLVTGEVTASGPIPENDASPA